jgi:hypothetical protein
MSGRKRASEKVEENKGYLWVAQNLYLIFALLYWPKAENIRRKQQIKNKIKKQMEEKLLEGRDMH